jgi:putative ABC transport system permease protein
MRWAVRTSADPAGYAAIVREAASEVDRGLLLTEMQPMDTLVRRARASSRFSLWLIGLFAAVAAVLAGVGIHGVLSTVVGRRTAEIGLRMALGAAPGSVLRLVIGHGLKLSAAGMALGVMGTIGLSRALGSLLVGVTATDPATLVAVAILYLVIAGTASWLPARRAAAIDPAVALGEG